MKKNLLISLLVLLLTFTVLEASFLWWFPRIMPSNVVMTIADEGLQPALQTSKRTVRPENYIALFGDSHAQGMGDWAAATMSEPQARYGIAHLLQDLTGLDVISLGSAGAGSVRAMVTEPVSQFAYLRQYIDKDIDQPGWVLVLFYEGNDLYDNAAYFRYSFPRLFDINLQYDAGTYRQYLQEFAIARDDGWRVAQRNDALRHFPFLVFLDRMVRAMAGLPPRADPVDETYDASLDPPWIFGAATFKKPGHINRALIGGYQVQLPDSLQGPALSLNDTEWRQAWFAFEQSLDFSRQHFPRSRFVLVYIPSVLGSYTLAGDQVSVQPYERRETVYPVQQLQEKSWQMRTELADIANRHGLPFIDTTDDVRQAAALQPLHGPGDWNHPNRQGYAVLSATIARHLAQLQSD